MDNIFKNVPTIGLKTSRKNLRTLKNFITPKYLTWQLCRPGTTHSQKKKKKTESEGSMIIETMQVVQLYWASSSKDRNRSTNVLYVLISTLLYFHFHLVRIFILFYVLPIVGSKHLRIRIRSEGCSDRGRYRGCGRAYIWVNGRDLSSHKRGHNVVVLDYYTGKRLSPSF